MNEHRGAAWPLSKSQQDAERQTVMEYAQPTHAYSKQCTAKFPCAIKGKGPRHHDRDRLEASPFALPTLPLVFLTPFLTSLLSALLRTGLPRIFATPSAPLPLPLLALAGVFGLDGFSVA